MDNIKEFWEWCGFTVKPIEGEEYLGDYYFYPDSNRIERYMDFTLDNLFLYALPKLKEMGLWVEIQATGDHTDVFVSDYNTSEPLSFCCRENPAQALYEAIRRIALDFK